MENEIWKPVKGYEGLYEVSNMGMIKCLPRTELIERKDGVKFYRTRKEKITKGHLSHSTEKYDKYTFGLKKDGTTYQTNISILVAQAFIPNPENKPCVDHINTIPTDNRVCNLRWVTHKENMENPLTKIHSSIGAKQRDKLTRMGVKRPTLHKPILQYSKDNVCIREWESIQEAGVSLDICQGDISRCCSGKRITAGGFKWQYK